MAFDVPAPSAYTHVVMAHVERGFSIHFPDARELRAAPDTEQAEAALLRRLDGDTVEVAAEPLTTAAIVEPNAVAQPKIGRPHSVRYPLAIRLGVIAGGSALLWAAIGYGIVA